MKKLLCIIVTVFVLLALTACDSNGYTEETQNYAETQNGLPSGSENPPVLKDDVDVMQNLAGVWHGLGLWLYVHADGTWYGGGGDIDFRGNIELAQDGGEHIVEFIALEARGPGARYSSYGSIREDVIAVNEETGEYFWVPVYNGPFLWFSGIYKACYDNLVTEFTWDGSRYEMERIS